MNADELRGWPSSWSLQVGVDQQLMDDSKRPRSAAFEPDLRTRSCASRSAQRQPLRVGHHDRFGVVETLSITKLRQVRRSDLFVDSLQRRCRIDQIFFAVRDGGLSQRNARDVKVGRLVAALGARHLGNCLSEHLWRSALELVADVARVR